MGWTPAEQMVALAVFALAPGLIALGVLGVTWLVYAVLAALADWVERKGPSGDGG